MLPPQLQSARDAIDSALRSHFEACLDYVKRQAAGGGALKAWNGDAARALLDNLHEQIAANNFSVVSSWPLPARRSLLAAIETSHRLVVLAGELSDQLARIAPSRPAHRPQLQAQTAAA